MDCGIEKQIHIAGGIDFLRDFDGEVWSRIQFVILIFLVLGLLHLPVLLPQLLEVDADQLCPVFDVFLLEGAIEGQLPAQVNQNQLVRFLTIQLVEVLVDELPQSFLAADIQFVRVGPALQHAHLYFEDLLCGLLELYHVNDRLLL